MGESYTEDYEKIYSNHELAQFFGKIDHVVARNEKNSAFANKYGGKRIIISNNEPADYFKKIDLIIARKRLSLPNKKR